MGHLKKQKGVNFVVPHESTKFVSLDKLLEIIYQCRNMGDRDSELGAPILIVL